MALSMEERRILAEIETHLSEEDPRLDHRMSKLGRAGRRRRTRLILLLAVAAAALAAGAALAIVSALS